MPLGRKGVFQVSKAVFNTSQSFEELFKELIWKTQPGCCLVGLRYRIRLYNEPASSKHAPYSRDIQVLFEEFMNGFKVRFSTKSYTIDWLKLEVGIALEVDITCHL
ncbi:hypothetical protein PoB_004001000 [Plakobranchus ocellatus]|uniref:Uncharacterized protein n=1 Tax=Plakobranchus ocellatus TaxID=259542 RepID=A0AAV4B1P4_9GAST|nr:hypothetical protein PoB_004001000 [Plakobranchus ocellatus]